MFRPDLLAPGGWRHQRHRYLRSYARDVQPLRSSKTLEDHLFHCVQDCWNLKDWIAADADLAPETTDAVEAAVEGKRALRLIGDLANAAKHFRRSAKPPSRSYRYDAYITSKSVSVNLGGGPAHIVYTATLDRRLDASDVGRAALS